MIRSTRESTAQRKQPHNILQLKGWAKIPIPKQTEDEHIAKKKEINVLGIAQEKEKWKSKRYVKMGREKKPKSIADKHDFDKDRREIGEKHQTNFAQQL